MAALMVKAQIRTMVAVVVLTFLMFAAAGTILWLPAWIYFAILVLSTMLPFYGPLQFDPGLIEERMSSRPDAKKWDRAFVALIAVFTPAELILPGLDHRWQWSTPLPGWMMWAGTAGVAAGTAGLVWAMWTNRFFSVVIRIQRDRGHQVVTDGPYRWVRHPGYLAWMLQSLSLPLLFCSVWTFLPVGLMVVMFFVRTALEDRVLMGELPGYKEYAQRVKTKLVPGIW